MGFLFVCVTKIKYIMYKDQYYDSAFFTTTLLTMLYATYDIFLTCATIMHCMNTPFYQEKRFDHIKLV